MLVDPNYQGTFLNETEIASAVGVSRTPVREALRVLASEGLVEQLPNRGTFVPPMSNTQITDLMQLRRVLETFAAGRSLKSGNVPVEQMRDVLNKQNSLLEVARDSNIVEFIRLDHEFHTHLMVASGNSEMVQIYKGLQVKLRVSGAQAMYEPSRWPEVCAEHSVIISGLESGVIAEAEKAIVAHLDSTLRKVLQRSHLVTQ